MDSRTTSQLSHLQERLARLEWLFRKADELLRQVWQAQQIQGGNGGDAWSSSGGWHYRLTGPLAAATSLSGITHANAQPQKFTGTTLADDPDASPVVVYNYHDKTFALSAIVIADPGTGGKLWVDDVRSCGSVS